MLYVRKLANQLPIFAAEKLKNQAVSGTTSVGRRVADAV
jgi:hypothetical protein